MDSFDEKHVVVTGGASGIGLGIAKAFYERGAWVTIGDYREDALQIAKDEFPDTEHLQCIQVDVRSPQSVAKFFNKSANAMGEPVIVVANAGIYPNTPVIDMDPDEWDRVMETNARGAFLTCQQAARRMVKESSQGKIITISSGASQSGRKGAAHYCASKAAIVMLTKVLALEMAEHGINVNCVSPGLVEVNSEVNPLSEEYITTLTNSIPLGRIGMPMDIARGVMFLASPEADFITGTVLSVDGGSSAGRASLPLSNPK